MKILGVHSLTHDVGAALFDGGTITYAVEEEKLSRVKHHPGIQFGGTPPVHSVEYIKSKLTKGLDDVDFFVHVGWPGSNDEPLDIAKRMYRDFALQLDSENKKTIFVTHHLAHAASAYFASGFSQSIVIVVDGHGDYIATSVYLAKKGEYLFKKIEEYFVDQSLGMMYTRAAKTLGLGGLGYGEGKLSALAAYGKPIKQIQLIDIEENRYFINEYSNVFAKYKREKNETLTQNHIDFAATVQEAIEKAILHTLNEIWKKYKINNVCFAGGVGLNCKLNGKIRDLSWINNFFVFPAPNDSGLCIGAAYLGAMIKQQEIRRLDTIYLGPEFAPTEVENYLISNQIKFVKTDASRMAADCISNGRIVAWAQKALEFGPRALGHRSLLGDPRDTNVRDRINIIKKRESWRPVCPAVIDNRYFTGDHHSLQHMMVAAKANDMAKKEIPAAIHHDGSARFQYVQKSTDPFYLLIKEFEKITTVPAILNTSLNASYEPICSTIDDIIKFFYTTQTDDLFIDNYWVTKKNI